MTQPTPLSTDLMNALRREWWLVVLAIAAAVAVGVATTASVKPSYTANGAIALDAVTLGRNAPLMTGDRLLEALKSADFYEYAASRTGVEADDVKAVTAVTAANTAQDRLTVRVTGTDKRQTEEFATAFVDAVISYAEKKGTADEIARLTALVEVSKTALADAEKQKARVIAGSNDPLALVEIEARMTEFRQAIINATAQVDSLQVAYRADGSVKLAEQSSSAKLQRTLVGAGVAGLFAGLVIAALREFLLRRRAAA